MPVTPRVTGTTYGPVVTSDAVICMESALSHEDVAPPKKRYYCRGWREYTSHGACLAHN